MMSQDTARRAHITAKLKIVQGLTSVTIVLLLTISCSLLTAASAATWRGVDESVVERYAEEHGRAARDPIINTDQGDLLLFVFLLAGLAGGFAAGYYWRMLTEKRAEGMEVSADAYRTLGRKGSKK